MPKSLISIRDFSKDEILHILDVAKEFEKNHEQNFLAGKVIACLFFEPSPALTTGTGETLAAMAAAPSTG